MGTISMSAIIEHSTILADKDSLMRFLRFDITNHRIDCMHGPLRKHKTGFPGEHCGLEETESGHNNSKPCQDCCYNRTLPESYLRLKCGHRYFLQTGSSLRYNSDQYQPMIHHK